MKNINLLHWRNTQDNANFNLFKKYLLLSFSIFLLILTSSSIYFLYEKNLLAHNQQIKQHSLLAANENLLAFLNFISQNLSELNALLNLQNNLHKNYITSNSLQKLLLVYPNISLSEINKLDNLINIKGSASDEKSISSWLSNLQNVNGFLNVRLIDLHKLQNSKTAFTLEIYLNPKKNLITIPDNEASYEN